MSTISTFSGQAGSGGFWPVNSKLPKLWSIHAVGRGCIGCCVGTIVDVAEQLRSLEDCAVVSHSGILQSA
eukprot:3952106-Lingulodinium_polyedra.AAC.1